VSSRSEPLLWLQLLAIGAIPLELILLQLVLAGSDLGPVPVLERLLTWALGALAPAVLLWRQPADWGSLLLVRIRPDSRSRVQRQLSSLQSSPLIRVLAASGVLVLLFLFWWIDSSAVLVRDLSPLAGSSRLTCLLVAIPILAMLLWQWQQLIQAIWLLTCDPNALDAVSPMDDSEFQTRRLSFGLGLLRLENLHWDVQIAATAAANASNAAVSIEPEQAAEEDNSSNLNSEVTENNIPTGTAPEAHDEKSEPTGSEESKPEESPKTPPGSA
jgi:hypothetical protein